MEKIEISEEEGKGIVKRCEYYFDSIYELIGDWKKGEKSLEKTAEIMKELSNFSSSLEKSIQLKLTQKTSSEGSE